MKYSCALANTDWRGHLDAFVLHMKRYCVMKRIFYEMRVGVFFEEDGGVLWKCYVKRVVDCIKREDMLNSVLLSVKRL